MNQLSDHVLNKEKTLYHQDNVPQMKQNLVGGYRLLALYYAWLVMLDHLCGTNIFD